MRGKAVILTPWADAVQGCNELFAGAVAAVFAVVVGAADMDVVAAASVKPPGDDVPGWVVALGWIAAAGVAVVAAAAGPAVDATAGVAADPAPAVGGIDTGAGGPI